MESKTIEHVQTKKPIAKLIGGVLTLAVIAGLANSSILMTDAGYTYVHQNNLTGDLDVFTTPGIHFRTPFLSKITMYDQVITVSYGSTVGENSQQSLPLIRASFADTYVGNIPVTFRFKLSQDPEAIKKMHREFRNNTNLIDALLVKNARNVTVITATQYTGEEFFQGGLNQFKTQLDDQLRNGIYMTERRKVEVEQTDLAPVSFNQSDANQLQRKKQLVWKTIPVLDEKGIPRRQENPLQRYGIAVTQITIGDPKPEEQLEKLLADKKRLVAERIRAIQEQETSKALSETEQLKKEIQRTRAVQDAQRNKELVMIAQQKELEIAKGAADRKILDVQKKKQLAEVEKQKELAIAQANLEIQKANALAAEYEAKAILAKGRAEAEVLQAKYDALGANKDVYLAEMNRDVSTALYQNLRNYKIEMPKNYFGGSDSGKMTTNLDIITGLGALGILDKSEQYTEREKAKK
ncbi:SPFH domain-containing protein [Photobacterium galatheae]|uniref:Band 7 domain-containing protein n=1 Tax=Photobacterium galatheae TaxID=1654360 RepID=A0A066RPQ2_9GAMM|nr:SPFH domain-containing protein [Photobacterium galatheae]KDM91086.1 hypothetical protein EA58_13085 [Photobacterium galatheae]MCM0150194.1 hypothetical protein [Photobacterium galatheae]